MKTAEEILRYEYKKWAHDSKSFSTDQLTITCMKAYAEQETKPLRDALKQSNEREYRLHKQIELKKMYTKEQVEQEREKAFTQGWLAHIRFKKTSSMKKTFSIYLDNYKQQNPLK